MKGIARVAAVPFPLLRVRAAPYLGHWRVEAGWGSACSDWGQRCRGPHVLRVPGWAVGAPGGVGPCEGARGIYWPGDVWAVLSGSPARPTGGVFCALVALSRLYLGNVSVGLCMSARIWDQTLMTVLLASIFVRCVPV